MRNIYVLGVSLFLGPSIPQYFAMNTTYVDGHGPVRTNAIWFNDILNTIFSSPETVISWLGPYLITLWKQIMWKIEEFHGGNHSSTAKAMLEQRSLQLPPQTK
ncbi:hypothetical protein F3Y22_tig00116964pilonHSYRG00033 [Hibiscus syriacus]|uniref:Uncharacterized protein n=1 Tax=Hibiscus syriacus TaxID=106335 RepID=A0A6A2XL05_HIBSY|nr:hypothetical protein F3Y22_tig00116964pilonHSYRG00033 [Hibiscus syriacus]